MMFVTITEEMKRCFLSSFLFRGISELSEELEKEMFSGAAAFARGECVYKSSAFRRALGVIVNGTVRISTSDGENRMLLRDMGAGETFGAAALFGAGECYVSEIRAKSACTVVFVEESTLEKLFSAHPAAALNYIAFLSSKIRYLNRKISEISMHGSSARVFEYIKKNAGEDCVFTAPNMSVLAKTLNIGRSSLYRALDDLANGGHILRDGNKFTVNKGENLQ
jgi:CRP-like cAMP-binding protein